MSSFEEIFDDSLQGLRREQHVIKTEILAVALDDEMFFDKKATSVSLKTAVQLQRDELAAELLGDYPQAEPTPVSPPTRMLGALAKRDHAGKCIEREIRKAGGVAEGLKSAYELFWDRFESDERTMVEKAIKNVDVPAFHSLLLLAFQRI